MTRVLVLDSSLSSAASSSSRKLTDHFIEQWQKHDAQAVFIRRDLAANPPSHVSQDLFDGLVTPEAQRTLAQTQSIEESQQLIDELLTVDVLIIGAPMYNFSFPSTLKSWIDNIAIAGRTFCYTAQGRPQGLVHGKRVFMIASRGGVYSTGLDAAHNFQDTYLQAVFALLGMIDFTVIEVERQKMGVEQQLSGFTEAKEKINDVVTKNFTAP